MTNKKISTITHESGSTSWMEYGKDDTNAGRYVSKSTSKPELLPPRFRETYTPLVHTRSGHIRPKLMSKVEVVSQRELSCLFFLFY